LGRVHVPDGTDLATALARTTDLGIVAHPDDLELALVAPVLACRDDPDRWFTGVVVTDGAGSVRPAELVDLDDAGFAAVRAGEQCRAADAAAMSAVVLVGLPSAAVVAPGPGRDALGVTLAELVGTCRPDRVHTHNPADSHRTHVAVATAVVTAVRSASHRPDALWGWEGWRDLDWVDPDVRVDADVSAVSDDAVALARHHASQMTDKRYDIAARGRRLANATFADARRADAATEVARALDLTPVLDPAVDPTAYVLGVVDRFRRDVADTLSVWW
jgi:hypothetical protein